MNFTLTRITFSVCRLLRHVDPNVTIYSLDLCSKIDTTANITPFCTYTFLEYSNSLQRY